MSNPKFNSEDYYDPTAYEGLKPIIKEESEIESKANFLIKILKFIINESGFELIARIEIEHKQSRKEFR